MLSILKTDDLHFECASFLFTHFKSFASLSYCLFSHNNYFHINTCNIKIIIVYL